jgi:hypothetical protein
MDTYNANRFQPDICLSLTSEWLTRMMVSASEGKRWCAAAHSAAENDDFYVRHRAEQAELTSAATRANIDRQQRLLQLPVFTGRYAAEAMALVQARQPIITSLLTKKTDRVKLMRLRRIRVTRSENAATIDTLKTEFMKLSATPRYYLISVRTRTAGSHAIAVVSTKSAWLFGSNGHLYYYDPNLFLAVRWGGRSELNGFLDRSLLTDYASINSIWEVAQM